jgi:hypothetical protein
MLKLLTGAVVTLMTVFTVFMAAGCDFSFKDSDDDRNDAPTALPQFNINNLPSPEWWNSQGHFHNLPDLFTFANGSKVTTPADWENRRKEILKIVQYYEYGMMPRWPDAITWDDTPTANGVSTVIHVTVGSSTKDFTVEVTLPTTPKLRNAKTPVLFQVANTNGFINATINGKGYATAGLNVTTLQPEGGYGPDGMNPQGGIVGQLYNWQRNADLPSCNIAYAWAMGVIIHVIEQGGFGGKLDPTGVMITGFSRWGKAAAVAGAMAESDSGQRIALTIAGSSGMGGTALERFLTPAGLGGGSVNPDEVTSFEGSVGKNVYLKPMPDSTNSSGGNSVIAVKKGNGETSTYNGRNEATWGFIQSYAEGRNEQGGWFGKRFQGFKDLHFGVDMDYDLSPNPQTGRAKDGWLCTIPFDQHFLVALAAPNGFIIHDGYKTRRNNPESQYLNYLAVKEVYEFLGKGPNIGIRLYNIPHTQPNYEFEDMANFADALFGFSGGSGTNTAPDVQADELPLFRAAAYPLDDPLSKWDYYRLYWARPGATSIAAQVKALLGE